MGSAGKDKAPLRFDSGKRAVETKLLKLVLLIVGGIGTTSSRAWMHKVRVWRAHREVIRLFLSIDVGCSPLTEHYLDGSVFV